VTIPPVLNTYDTLDSEVGRPKDIRQAAAQFEALLVSQMLKSMHEADGSGWLGTGDDQAGSAMADLAEEHLSQVLAAQGGLGLANMVVKNLDSGKPGK
jgi:Rod binding domain-containing protein